MLQKDIQYVSPEGTLYVAQEDGRWITRFNDIDVLSVMQQSMRSCDMLCYSTYSSVKLTSQLSPIADTNEAHLRIYTTPL